jgi:hypothetical protein
VTESWYEISKQEIHSGHECFTAKKWAFCWKAVMRDEIWYNIFSANPTAHPKEGDCYAR